MRGWTPKGEPFKPGASIGYSSYSWERRNLFLRVFGRAEERPLWTYWRSSWNELGTHYDITLSEASAGDAVDSRSGARTGSPTPESQHGKLSPQRAKNDRDPSLSLVAPGVAEDWSWSSTGSEPPRQRQEECSGGRCPGVGTLDTSPATFRPAS
jgi:hypothetical protein